MKTFNTTAIVRHPPLAVVAVMRDRLPELASHLSEIKSVERTQREALADGGVKITHRWQANIELPAAVRSAIGADLAWLDHAVWSADGMKCLWRIEPLFLEGQLDCRGSALYSPALGARGTRVAFEGNVDIDRVLATGRLSGVSKMVASLSASVVTSVVPKSLRHALDAAATILEGEDAKHRASR